MTTYDPPIIQELRDAWLDRLTKDYRTEIDEAAAKEAFNAGIDEIRADALHTASLASANGIPLHMTAPDWLNLQAGLYTDRTFLTEPLQVVKSPPAEDLLAVARPELVLAGEHLEDVAVGELLFGAACWVRESRMFGSNLRATVATALWHAGEAVWANPYGSRRHDDALITMPRPHVPYGPVGATAEAADADYLRKAARDIERFYKPFTPEVRAGIVQLLRDLATAVEALVPASASAE